MSAEEWDIAEARASSELHASSELQSRLSALRAIVDAATRLEAPVEQGQEAGSDGAGPSGSAVAVELPERERSRSRDRTVDNETSYGDITEFIVEAEEEVLPEPPRTCSCRCFQSRHLGPRGDRSRRCACPLCGHHGCHRRIRIHVLAAML